MEIMRDTSISVYTKLKIPIFADKKMAWRCSTGIMVHCLYPVCIKYCAKLKNIASNPVMICSHLIMCEKLEDWSSFAGSREWSYMLDGYI